MTAGNVRPTLTSFATSADRDAAPMRRGATSAGCGAAIRCRARLAGAALARVTAAGVVGVAALSWLAPDLGGQSAPDSPDTLAATLPVAWVVIAPETLEVSSGDSVRFSATAYDSSRAPLRDVDFFWGAEPTLIGSVDSTGTFVAGGPMEGFVIARPVNAPVIGVARVRVLAMPVTEIRVEGPERVLSGSHVRLSVTGADRTGATRPLPHAQLRSSAPAVAAVEEGWLVARAPGSATITASSDGAEGVLSVRVTRSRATALEIVCDDCRAPAGTAAAGSTAEAGPASARTPTRGDRSEPPRYTVRVGDAVRLQARARGVEGPVASRWWTEGDEALLGEDGEFVAQSPGLTTVLTQFGALQARAVIEAVPRARAGIFRVVGRGPVSNPRVSDLWVFRGADGRDYAYTGSIGGDQVKVWDVTDPASPLQTDSLVVDARVINDVNLNATGRLGVLTREGASNRKNGIVLFDASDPAHPKVISEYTETVTSGVHNAFFDGDYIYCTSDGTRALHIISAKDPLRPVEVARWEIRPGESNKYLHDVIVQDGLAYLSYWDDGLVILDVGDGVKGGSPENPVFVSRIAYPEGHTHTAWRWKNWVFTGDEIFGGPPVTAAGGVPGGFLHVIDVADLENPVEVAWYEVRGAGAHNIWMDEEREVLYVSYYNGGVRALDVSGTLRGDLMKQGRELAYFLTGEPDPAKAAQPNSPMNWGPQLYRENVFSTDMNSGLWVLKYEDLPRLDLLAE